MDNNIRFCTECGFKMDKDYGFCPICGAKISVPKQEPIQNISPQSQGNQNNGTNYNNSNSIYYGQESTPQYYNQYTPPQYTPPKRHSNTVVIIIAVIIGVLVLGVGGYFGIKALKDKMGVTINSLIGDKNVKGQDNSTVDKKPKEQNIPQVNTGSQQSEKDKPTSNSSNDNKENTSISDNKSLEYLKGPALYIPKPSMKYAYESWYQDGTSGKVNVVVGVIPKFSVATSVELIEQSEAFTQHFVDRPDGVYTFSDQDFNISSSLWLPFNAKVGQSFESESVSRKIVQLGASCDLGFRKFDNCIVMEVDYNEVGIIYVNYIAPSLGTVLIIDKASGNVALKLLSVTPISDQEANDTVKRYSPNVMDWLK